MPQGLLHPVPPASASELQATSWPLSSSFAFEGTTLALTEELPVCVVNLYIYWLHFQAERSFYA